MLLLHSICNLWNTYAFILFKMQSWCHLCFYPIRNAIFGLFMLLLYSRCNIWVMYALPMYTMQSLGHLCFAIFKMQYLDHVCFYYLHDAIFLSHVLLLFSRWYVWVTYALPIFKMQFFVTYAFTILKVQSLGNLCFC